MRALRSSPPGHDLAYLDINSLAANRWIRAEPGSRRGIPGQDQLSGRLEARRAVQSGRGIVVRAGPDVAQGDAAFREELNRSPNQRLAYPLASVCLGDVELCHFALESRSGVEQDDPAEPGQTTGAVTNGKYDVLALERALHLIQGCVYLGPGELRVVGVVRLFVEMQIDQQRPNQRQLFRAQPV